eukprot:5196787-Heterocapsa_arctica.AAC.1
MSSLCFSNAFLSKDSLTSLSLIGSSTTQDILVKGTYKLIDIFISILESFRPEGRGASARPTSFSCTTDFSATRAGTHPPWATIAFRLRATPRSLFVL